MNLLHREPACDGAAGACLCVGLDEGDLNLELLVGELEDAVFVDLIADLAEEVRNVVGSGRRA